MLVLRSGNSAFLSLQSRGSPGLGPVPATLPPCCVLRGRSRHLVRAPLSTSHLPEAPEPSFLLSPLCLPPVPSRPRPVREGRPSSRSPGTGRIGGSRWGSSRSSLSLTKPGRAPTPSAQAGGAGLEGSAELGRDRVPLRGTQGEIIHPLMSHIKWKRPKRWQNPP